MRAYNLTRFGLENLKMAEMDEPYPLSYEVLVKFRAASLNYRDLMFAKGVYAPRAKLPAVPLSDGAGEVTKIGEGVTRWKVGDRVCPIFTQGWLDGAYSAEKARTSLGAGDLAGVLREFGTFHENGLVRVPEHLSFEEAATLPCAGVTAWHSLVVFGDLKPGETVLTLGTGGVSIFAIQFARLHGARIIATSSSDQKLARLRELGVSDTINYKSVPDWEKDVLRFTGNVGVDHVVEVGGAGTLAKSISATRIAGRIGVIGVLASGGGVNPISVLMKSLRVQGIFVGSRTMFEEMNRAISVNNLRPVIDKFFSFEDVPQALAYMESGAHFGKIVIKY
jgi:NADPH:quinone reductase-like Zn-dependent oxidoreductase